MTERYNLPRPSDRSDNICMHEDCLNCPILYKCVKDKNNYDEAKAIEKLAAGYCPKCGFILLQASAGYDFCIDCGYNTKELRARAGELGDPSAVPSTQRSGEKL